jgi:hypothetical protein
LGDSTIDGSDGDGDGNGDGDGDGDWDELEDDVEVSDSRFLLPADVHLALPATATNAMIAPNPTKLKRKVLDCRLDSILQPNLDTTGGSG